MGEEKRKPDVLQRLSEVEVGLEDERVPTGIGGLDECLADGSADSLPGIPRGCSVLLSGMPGGGKSTMATMMALAAKGPALYLHGEERSRSVRKRADRVKRDGAQDIWLSPLRSVEHALDDIRQLNTETDIERVIVDSIQVTSFDGSRKYDKQAEGVEMLVGQVCSNGGILIAVSHVSKTGNDHAGAAALAHLVDIHLHLTTNAKKMERVLEVRKNRHGRAGFQVPVNIGQTSLSVGVPAPLNPQEGLVAARNALEVGRDKAIELLMSGKTLSGYDFDLADMTSNPNRWRASLELAVKTMARDGHIIISEKLKGRMTHRLERPPVAVAVPVPDDFRPIELT